MVSAFEQRGGRGERPHARNRAGCGGQVGAFHAHLGARVSQPPHTSQPPCSSGPGRTKPGGWRTRTLGPRVPPESPAGQDPLSKRPLECGTPSDLAGPKSPHGVWTRGVPCFSRACRAAGCWGWAAPAPGTQGPGPGAALTSAAAEAPPEHLFSVPQGLAGARGRRQRGRQRGVLPSDPTPGVSGLARSVRSQYPSSICRVQSRR